ncbi:MAG: translational GTPase TypA [Tepidiformaceae bacterium]
MSERTDIRNIAIIAHVDHGKTTLVDAMLHQSGSFREHQVIADRVLDSMELEREKGITILAKNTAIYYGEVKINILDTPGHADFGGEVERALKMVDGVLLLVDASEGPLPQTRFVLKKALDANLAIILVVNKVDRQDARIHEVVDEVYELFFDLEATEEQINFPILFCDARSGYASHDSELLSGDLIPLFESLIKEIPAPTYSEDHPLQAQVLNLDASPYVGRLALCRIFHGEIVNGQTVMRCKEDGEQEPVKLTELYVTEALERVTASSAGPGEIIAIAGIPDITIGETITSLENPKPLPVLSVDEPSISLTLGINTSPLAGLEGTQLTGRLLEARLEAEALGNVSLRIISAERPDTWVVEGRGELQLAVLIETMRREGFELTVGKPEVLTREIDGVLHEPMERLIVDIPEDVVGSVTQLLAVRKGKLQQMNNLSGGRVRMEFIVPARGLIGFQTVFLTETRGEGVANHSFENFEPWQGDLRVKQTSSLVADRSGDSTSYALISLQERGILFIGPGEQVYEGMIIGENPRSEDMNVNPTRLKKQSNIRSSTKDETEKLTPFRNLSLEQTMELIQEDECLEVTPECVRMRKVDLSQLVRSRKRKEG